MSNLVGAETSAAAISISRITIDTGPYFMRESDMYFLLSWELATKQQVCILTSASVIVLFLEKKNFMILVDHRLIYPRHEKYTLYNLLDKRYGPYSL